VDANTGEIVAKEPLILFANANGTADTRYSGTRSIVTDSYTNGFRLHELRNNVRIETYNMGGTGVYSLTEFSNNDNNWSAVKFNNANMDNAALDAHWGTEMVYEYFHQIHGRNSWDSAGGPLLNYVHANLQTLGYPNNDNAFWDGQRMTYGDGQYTFYPLTSLDIIAHEIGHGVMQKSGKLTNTGESGALNEGFSDIWAACVKHWAAPEKPLWLQGGEPIRDRYHFNCLRDMQNPGSDSAAEGHHPDAYGGTNWQNVNSCIPISSGLNANDNCYVHNNSTVLSHWFYLLCQGGNSTNSLGNAYNVNVIGIAQAEKIAYRTQTTLFSSAKYTDVRNASIQAAIYLYGAGSCQEVAVTNVWYAVGVGAAYSGNGTFPISGPSIVCSSGTYSISNVPAGSTVTWSISSTSAFTLAPSGNSVVVNRVGTYSGTATLFATINRGSCSIPVSKTVSSTGSANMTFSMTGSCTGGVPQWWDVTATSDNITYHLWTVASASPGAVVNLYQNGGNNLNASASISSGYATLKLTTTDACGNTTIYGVPIYNPCVSAGSSYSVSPNPASSTVDIQPVTASMDLSSTSSTSTITPEITQVNIYDKSGNRRHQQGFGKVRRAKLNVSKLPAGIYYVEIIMNDGTKEKHTLSVAH
jgi:Zn-dependent metalloprotease